MGLDLVRENGFVLNWEGAWRRNERRFGVWILDDEVGERGC